jgi:histone acetyltransferase (RNA polymerase elongator complex component)
VSLVIPIFIPHQGCPQHCLFCNQIIISGSGAEEADDPELIVGRISQWLGFSKGTDHVQVAFYGGSFSCLPLGRQKLYLDAVQPFIKRGDVDSIRLSTRPDCVDAVVCDFLLEYGVKTVELGVQSLDNSVLRAAKRGHCMEDSLRAMSTIKDKGLELGVQLMPGLPRENTVSFLKTLALVIEHAPDFVRLYPTLVIRGSGLAVEYSRGNYTPMSMNRAIALCHLARKRLTQAGVRIVRMGLQASESLEKELLAGPYHPAFGEYVVARDWFLRVRTLLLGCAATQQLHVQICDRDLSAFVGPKRANMKRLKALGLEQKLILTTDKKLQRGTLNHVIN